MSENDQFWKRLGEKVANLDHVPGEPVPSTEYLWSRLQQRIQQGKRRRRIYRYGIAAALAITCSLLVLSRTKKKNTAP
jgi:hypothetical protein